MYGSINVLGLAVRFGVVSEFDDRLNIGVDRDRKAER